MKVKTKWIIFALIASIAIHISIFAIVGKIHLNLPEIDFIETFFFENKQKTNANPSNSKPTKEEKISEKAENSENKTDTSTATSHSDENPLAESDTQMASSTAPTIASKPQSINPLSKFINEYMKFDIYWMGIYVGSAVMSVKGNENDTVITSEVRSAGFISNFYYVNDRAQSKIESGKPKHFTLIQVEGKHRGNKETLFDYEKGEIVFINHLKNNTTFHTNIDKVFWDVLSGFFYLRSLPIDLKTNPSVDIFDSNKFVKVNIQILREEKIERYDKKEVDALVVKPQLDTEGLFKRKGDILIWLSRDENKIPLKVETKVPVGTVVAELKEYKKE